MTGSGEFSSRVARGSTLIERQPAAPAFRFALCNAVQGCRPARMKTARNKPTAAKLRSWRVIITRSRGEYLGSVEAPDRERAEAEAIKLFELDQDQRSRLLILVRL
jgi:hypothetical protein